MADYKITVVMPALNEEQNIVRAVENTVAAFHRTQTEGEIIVVDDGSCDSTGSLVKQLQLKYAFIRMIRHETPHGVGKSFWDGVQQARGEAVTFLPGDGENDGYEIMRYLPMLDHVDIVIPFVFNQETRSKFRRMLSTLYRTIVNLSFGISLNYFNGTVIYRKGVLEKVTLKSKGFFYQTELLIKTLLLGYLFAEVPYGLGRRGGGKSKAVSLKSLIRVTRDFSLLFLDVYLGSRTSKSELAVATCSAKRYAEFSTPPLTPVSAPKKVT